MALIQEGFGLKGKNDVKGTPAETLKADALTMLYTRIIFYGSCG